MSPSSSEVLIALTVADLAAVFGTPEPRRDTALEIADGVTLHLKGVKRYASPIVPDIVYFLLDVTRDLSVGVAAAALWDFISAHREKGSVTTIRVTIEQVRPGPVGNGQTMEKSTITLDPEKNRPEELAQILAETAGTGKDVAPDVPDNDDLPGGSERRQAFE